jgi:hypothetical protein
LLLYLGFIYLALALYFLSLLLLCSIYVFPTVLAVCILGTPSSYTWFASTPLSPYWLSSHHTFCYPAVLSRICVVGFLSRLDSWPVRMGPIRCPETSINNYHTRPRNTPEDRRFYQHRGRSLKSFYAWYFTYSVQLLCIYKFIYTDYCTQITYIHAIYSYMFSIHPLW